MSFIEQMFSLEGRVCIVTGGARGNGLAIVKAFLGAGAKVVVLDLSRKDLDLVRSFDLEGSENLSLLECDITSKRDVDESLRIVVNKFGRVNVLVNNAGITMGCPTLEYTREFWNKTIEVNLTSLFHLTQSVINLMLSTSSKNCSIINITSLNSETAFPDNPAYVASKGAVKQLTKSLALDMGKHQIRVNNLGPGYIKTSMTAGSWKDPSKRAARSKRTCLGRWGMPDDLSGAAIFLASDASRYVTGIDLYVDGGWLARGL